MSSYYYNNNRPEWDEFDAEDAAQSHACDQVETSLQTEILQATSAKTPVFMDMKAINDVLADAKDSAIEAFGDAADGAFGDLTDGIQEMVNNRVGIYGLVFGFSPSEAMYYLCTQTYILNNEIY